MEPLDGSLILVFVYLAFFAGLGLFFIINALTKKDSKVFLKSVTGPIKMVAAERHTRSSKYIQHELHVGDREFDVIEEICGHVVEGNVYSIYYIEKMNGWDDEILSLERIARG